MSKGRGQRGSIETLDDGRHVVRYYTDGRGGRRPQKTFPANRKREAAQWLRDRLDEVDAARDTDGDAARAIRERERDLTVDEMVARYLAAHEADPATINKLRQQLLHARRAFGPRGIATLEPYELQAWRKGLKPGSRADVFRALAQVYRQAERWHWIAPEQNPTAGVPNPRPKRREVVFQPWEYVEAIADEIDERYSAAPIVVAGAGLRLEELLALERADVDLVARTLKVRRVFAHGTVTELGADGRKTKLQRRNVPLRKVVVDALRAQPARIDTRLLFPAPEGGHLRVENFRSRIWTPAVEAAGVPYFPPKDLRHVFASEALAAGLGLFDLSRLMGTSMKEIDATYGHRVADADQRDLARLDAYDAAREQADDEEAQR